MMFTYLPLDALPTVPEHFCQRAIDLVRDRQDLEDKNVTRGLITAYSYHDRDVKIADGTVKKSRVGETYDMGPDWEQWVRDNIIADFIETSVKTAGGIHRDRTTTYGAHVDTSTPDHPYKLKLYYLVQEGGDDVVTSWYQQHGHPAVRLDSTPENVVCSLDYSDLTLLDAVRIPVGRWIAFDTRVMHGVENIMGNRIVLAVCVDPEAITFAVKPKPREDAILL